MSGDGVALHTEDDVIFAQSFFYWEAVIFVQRMVLMAAVFYMERPYLQGIVVFFILVGFTLMQLRNNPYCTSRLQGLHVLSLLLCVLFSVFKLLIYGMSNYTGEISEATLERVDRDILLRSRAYNYVDS